MTIKKQLDQLVSQLIDSIPPGMQKFSKELEKQFHLILKNALVKMDLVTREEFSAQVRVLQRTREKLEAVEKELVKLEAHAKKTPVKKVSKK